MLKKTQFNFLKISKILTPISITSSFVALIIISVFGFFYGVDFTGGNEIHVRFKKTVQIQRIRQVLTQANIQQGSVQEFGSDKEFLIRTKAYELQKSSAKTTPHHDELNQLIQKLKTHFQKEQLEIRRIDSIGPQIGQELRRSGILALIYSLLMILIYLGLRFDIKYAPAAVFCLFHDAVITMSIFSIFKLEVNVQTLAAILAIIGYSLNDTIVTFDRIRENHLVFGKKKSFYDICNISLNEILSRTLLTSITTLLAVVAMYLQADGVIKDFAFTLILGVCIGTYSSIYIATPLLIYMNKFEFFQKK